MSSAKKEKVAIVGAGIVGLAHAWSAAQRGHEVTVFERTARASGASIRNFGMVWVIGQREEAYEIASTSRDRWVEMGRQSGIWVNACGSIHVAHRDDEWQVLQEYVDRNRKTDRGSALKLLTRDEVLAHSPAVNPNGLLGGLWSSTECCVEPTTTIRAMPSWLAESYGVTFRFQTLVTEVDAGRLRTVSGEEHRFDRIVICSGHDLQSLRPEVYHQQPIRPCKLHMMRTIPQPGGWRIGPHIASGLTLRHYPNFQVCGSLQALIQRVAAETPELDRYGIHVMASQNAEGQVVLGDSHQYDDEIEPFDEQVIDDCILRELKKILVLPTWEMNAHWHGIYAKYTAGIAFEAALESGVHVCTGLGGNGMTLSFGIAERAWKRWES